MKILKYLMLFIASVILLILIVALFVDGDFRYEKSIEINAPVETVWENVNSLEDINKWSPWIDKDPQMITTKAGESGEIGQTFSWDSEVEDVGSGSQTITAINAPHEIQTLLKFYDPYEAEAEAFVLLEESTKGTKATWGFENEMPYPWRIGRLFMDMGEMMEADYTLGFERLKALSEK